MDKIADSLFILEEDGSVSGWVGKCSEYIQYRDEKAREEMLEQSREKAALTEAAAASTKETAPKKKLSFKEQKEFEALETEIAALEDEKTELETKMQGGSSGDFSNLQEVSQRYSEVSTILETKYHRWEELAAFI